MHTNAPGQVRDAADLRAYLSDNGIEIVEAWTPDIHGVMRGKRFPASGFPELAESGFHLADAILCWTRTCELYDDVAFSNFATGYPDLLVLPDPTTIVQLPWSPSTAVVLCRLATLDRAPIEVDPRTVLLRQVERLAAEGFDTRVAIEYEFTAVNAAAEPALDRVECYVFQPPNIGPFLESLTLDLVRLGVPVEASETEYGVAQLEITLHPAPALLAADQALMFKSFVKAAARRHDLVATFMPKPFADQAGNGMHLNESLWRGGRNAFDNGNADFVGTSYLGGLMAATRSLFLLGAPTVNSFKRRTAGTFAPTTSTWSSQSRTVGMRALFDRGPSSSRVEFRTPGADANPYLAVAGTLASGLRGILERMEPPPEYSGDAYTIDDQSLMLPASLEDAIEAFATSKVARELGEPFVSHYTTVVRHEATDFGTAVTDWERQRYLHHA
jgi:glutamine synthetase